jgi:DNA-binding PadR family transcriptional regulator
LNRIQFIILSCLLSESADNNVNAMSIKEIIENLRSLEYTYNSFYKHTKALLAAGYIAAGLPAGNSKTYYITRKGKEALEIVKGEDGE